MAEIKFKIMETPVATKEKEEKITKPVYFSDPYVEMIYLFGREKGFVGTQEQSQCWAIGRLLKQYSKSQLLSAVKMAAKALGEPYAPQIVNFNELEAKITKLSAWAKREKTEPEPEYKAPEVEKKTFSVTDLRGAQMSKNGLASMIAGIKRAVDEYKAEGVTPRKAEKLLADSIKVYAKTYDTKDLVSPG